MLVLQGLTKLPVVDEHDEQQKATKRIGVKQTAKSTHPRGEGVCVQELPLQSGMTRKIFAQIVGAEGQAGS